MHQTLGREWLSLRKCARHRKQTVEVAQAFVGWSSTRDWGRRWVVRGWQKEEFSLSRQEQGQRVVFSNTLFRDARRVKPMNQSTCGPRRCRHQHGRRRGRCEQARNMLHLSGGGTGGWTGNHPMRKCVRSCCCSVVVGCLLKARHTSILPTRTIGPRGAQRGAAVARVMFCDSIHERSSSRNNDSHTGTSMWHRREIKLESPQTARRTWSC